MAVRGNDIGPDQFRAILIFEPFHPLAPPLELEILRETGKFRLTHPFRLVRGSRVIRNEFVDYADLEWHGAVVQSCGCERRSLHVVLGPRRKRGNRVGNVQWHEQLLEGAAKLTQLAVECFRDEGITLPTETVEPIPDKPPPDLSQVSDELAKSGRAMTTILVHVERIPWGMFPSWMGCVQRKKLITCYQKDETERNEKDHTCRCNFECDPKIRIMNRIVSDDNITKLEDMVGVCPRRIARIRCLPECLLVLGVRFR